MRLIMLRRSWKRLFFALLLLSIFLTLGFFIPFPFTHPKPPIRTSSSSSERPSPARFEHRWAKDTSGFKVEFDTVHRKQQPSLESEDPKASLEGQGQKPSPEGQGRKMTPGRRQGQRQGNKSPKEHQDRTPSLERLGVLATRGPGGWSSLNCDRRRTFRQFTMQTVAGNMSVYLYNSSSEDISVTRWAQQGWYFESKEKGRFLNLSRDLPLIDVGANLGLVTIPAAMQGRQVVALEPVRENALRLCRSVLDFGHAASVHVFQNAVSSSEGNVTLAMEVPKLRVTYEMARSKGWGYEATAAYSIVLDRLLELLPFKRAALKIDVESHEGHVLAGAERLFQEVDLPMVWLEWEHVKRKKDYGGAYIIQFMDRHGMVPHNLMTGLTLSAHDFLNWPFTVLWLKRSKMISQKFSPNGP